MPAGGGMHTVLLRSDGRAVAFGSNTYGQCDVPELKDGTTYVQAAAGLEHTVLLRSDGQAVGFGFNSHGQCITQTCIFGRAVVHLGDKAKGKANGKDKMVASACEPPRAGQKQTKNKRAGQSDVPKREPATTYVQVAARGDNTVLLRSDGRPVAFGQNPTCVPEPERGATYVQVSVGMAHMVLLRSDGRAVAVAFADNGNGKAEAKGAGKCDVPDGKAEGKGAGKCDVPDGKAKGKGAGKCDVLDAEHGATYVQVAAGGFHTVLLRSDGRVVAFGDNRFGQCDVPEPEARATYVQVAAGEWHTVLLRSDGRAVAFGSNDRGQCEVPEAEPATSYVQVATGDNHTVLLRSDGRAFAVGRNGHNVPEPELGVSYRPNGAVKKTPAGARRRRRATAGAAATSLTV